MRKMRGSTSTHNYTMHVIRDDPKPRLKTGFWLAFGFVVF